jgi:hypothetical protein
MKQLSLVAFYGAKEPLLAGLLDHCRSTVAESSLGEVFQPYGAKQIHATITGMESLPGERRFNRNLWRKRGVEAPMDFSKLTKVLSNRLPMSIRQGRMPYERTFQVHQASGKVTLVGWPHVGGDFEPRRLERLRQDLAETCNIEHKYDGDNDLYLVLGTVESSAVAGGTPPVETTLRDYLRRHPLDIGLELAEVLIVRYEEETLDPASTVAYAVSGPGLTPGFLETLYDS